MILKHENDIGRRNKDNFWRDNIAKEMAEVGINFKVLEDVKVAPIGWKKVTFHLVCNIKMYFTRKSRWVLYGHKITEPIGSTYAGVVSWESVGIAFTYAALNEFDVSATDIRNAYSQALSGCKM